MDKVINFVPFDKHHLEEPVSFGPGDTVTVNVAVPAGATNFRVGVADSVSTARIYMTMDGGATINSMGSVAQSVNDPTPGTHTAVFTCQNGSVDNGMVQIGVSLPKGHPQR